MASAGLSHTVAVTMSGELFTFGNGSSGQLGHNSSNSEFVPRVVEGLLGKHVVMASAGSSHTVAVTISGELFTFGECSSGRLGHNSSNDEFVPRVVEGLLGKHVVIASAGWDHSVAVTMSGELFTFGNGSSGQLGHNSSNDEFVPRVVEGLLGNPVVMASAGWDHTVAVTMSGELFTFGDGSSGRLGHNSSNTEFVPRVVEGLLGNPVVMASAGSSHTVAVTISGGTFHIRGGLSLLVGPQFFKRRVSSSGG